MSGNTSVYDNSPSPFGINSLAAHISVAYYPGMKPWHTYNDVAYSLGIKPWHTYRRGIFSWHAKASRITTWHSLGIKHWHMYNNMAILLAQSLAHLFITTWRILSAESLGTNNIMHREFVFPYCSWISTHWWSGCGVYKYWYLNIPSTPERCRFIPWREWHAMMSAEYVITQRVISFNSLPWARRF